jgi:fatty acid desaturase
MGEAAKKFIKQTGERPTARQRSGWLLDVLVFQTLFGLSLLITAYAFNTAEGWSLAAYNAGASYGVVYLYGLMSVTVFMASLRAIAEHQQYDDASAHSGYAALRNFTSNSVSRYLMGAYGFSEHYTHHRVPSIPYYNLREATRQLASADVSLLPRKGYFQVLADIVTR